MIDTGTYTYEMSFSPDGSRILGSCPDGPWRLWKAADGALLTEINPPAERSGPCCFSPDGSFIIGGNTKGAVWAFDPATGAHQELVNREAPLLRIFFTADGARLLVVWIDGHASFINLRGEVEREMQLAEGLVEVRITSDSSRIVGATRSGQMASWDLGSGEPDPIVEFGGQIGNPRFSADASLLAFEPEKSRLVLWDTASRTETASAVVVEQPTAEFHPDGRRILLTCWSSRAGGAVYLWDPPAAPTRLPNLDSAVHGRAWDATGRFAAIGSRDKKIHVWEFPPPHARRVPVSQEPAEALAQWKQSWAPGRVDSPVESAVASRDAADGGPVAVPDLSMAGNTAGEVRSDNALKMELIWCPPGSFRMGIDADDPFAGPNDTPKKDVTLTQGFWLGKYEVTQSQWNALMGENPELSRNKLAVGPNYPIMAISWTEAAEFCLKLTEQERSAGRLRQGWAYTLPTEAQWEYACRAGTTTRFSFGDDLGQLAEYAISVTKRPGRVGTKKPNPWGFHDMHGNLWEWCRDWYIKSAPGGTDPEISSRPAEGSPNRVTRGAAHGYAAHCFKSCIRNSQSPNSKGRYARDVGFRVGLMMAPPITIPAGQPSQPSSSGPSGEELLVYRVQQDLLKSLASTDLAVARKALTDVTATDEQIAKLFGAAAPDVSKISRQVLEQGLRRIAEARDFIQSVGGPRALFKVRDVRKEQADLSSAEKTLLAMVPENIPVLETVFYTLEEGRRVSHPFAAFVVIGENQARLLPPWSHLVSELADSGKLQASQDTPKPEGTQNAGDSLRADAATVEGEMEAYVEPKWEEVYPKADVKLDADDYFAEFEAAKFREKYREKIIDVTGELDGYSSASEHVVADLRLDSVLSLRVQLAQDRPWTICPPGSRVTIRGKPGGILAHIYGGYIVSHQPGEVVELDAREAAQSYAEDEKGNVESLRGKVVLIKGKLLKQINEESESVYELGTEERRVRLVRGDPIPWNPEPGEEVAAYGHAYRQYSGREPSSRRLAFSNILPLAPLSEYPPLPKARKALVEPDYSITVRPFTAELLGRWFRENQRALSLAFRSVRELRVTQLLVTGDVASVEPVELLLGKGVRVRLTDGHNNDVYFDLDEEDAAKHQFNVGDPVTVHGALNLTDEGVTFIVPRIIEK